VAEARRQVEEAKRHMEQGTVPLCRAADDDDHDGGDDDDDGDGGAGLASLAGELVAVWFPTDMRHFVALCLETSHEQNLREAATCTTAGGRGGGHATTAALPDGEGLEMIHFWYASTAPFQVVMPLPVCVSPPTLTCQVPLRARPVGRQPRPRQEPRLPPDAGARALGARRRRGARDLDGDRLASMARVAVLGDAIAGHHRRYLKA